MEWSGPAWRLQPHGLDGKDRQPRCASGVRMDSVAVSYRRENRIKTCGEISSTIRKRAQIRLQTSI